MPHSVKNNFETTLVADITDIQTTMRLNADPALTYPYWLTIGNSPATSEIVEVTGKTVSDFNIVRAQQGTTAQAWVAGTKVRMFMTAGHLDEKANTVHTHLKADVTDFAHSHAISDVTNLQTALDSKAAVSHTHTVSQITDHTDPKDISIFIPGDMFVTTGIVRYVVGAARTVQKVRLAIASAPTDADLIIDVNKNGTTMFSTQTNRPKIVAGTTSGVSVAPDITALAEGDVVSIDIDQVGSTLPGTGLAITIMCT